jgi:hypothetical protein
VHDGIVVGPIVIPGCALAVHALDTHIERISMRIIIIYILILVIIRVVAPAKVNFIGPDGCLRRKQNKRRAFSSPW